MFSYPGVGLSLQQAALGHDYPVVQALLLVIALCVLMRELHHRLRLRLPRPAGADHRMSGFSHRPSPATTASAAPRLATPDWLRLLLSQPMSAFGIVLLSSIVLVTLFAPLLDDARSERADVAAG